VNPQLPINARRQTAALYIQMVALSSQAIANGLDKDPVVQERMRLEHLRGLAQAMDDNIRAKMKPTEPEVDTFYAENRDRFEELQVRGLMVPKTIDKQPQPEETKTLATQIQTRAAAGEDMDKLQEEAYKATKQTTAPPKTALGWRGRGRLGAHEDDLLK